MRTKPCSFSNIVLALLALSTLNWEVSSVFAQGALTPPGPPAPTMLTLNQIEPRTPISSAPFTITNPGSYYLTTNLTVVGFNGNGITISADDVTLDLNGFAISGDGSNNNSGVQVATSQNNICIRNGIIRNIPGDGVFAPNAGNSRFEELALYTIGNYGISVGSAARVTGCLARANGFGIFVGDGSDVRDCVFQMNGIGIQTGNACVVTDCSAVSNNFGAITCSYGCRVEGCTVAYSTQFQGIVVRDGSTIANCSVYGCDGGGIVAGMACIISDCSVDNDNGNGAGISCGPGSIVQGCAAAFDLGGISATNSLVRDCNVWNNYGNGVVSAGSTVSGCTIQNNTEDGISVYNGNGNSPFGGPATTSCLITGNTIQDNGYFYGPNGLGTYANIDIYDASNRIEGNHIVTYNPISGIAISFFGTATNNVIARNSVYGGSSTVNYYLPGQDVGPIGVAASAISPWSNISH